MSELSCDAVSKRPRKIEVLNEIVRILREHIDQREEKIGGLENQIQFSKEKIKNLEHQLYTDEDLIVERTSTPKQTSVQAVNSRSKSNHNQEFDEIDGYCLPKTSSITCSRKWSSSDIPYYCLNEESSTERPLSLHSDCNGPQNYPLKNNYEELREKMIELDKLKSSTSGSEKAELDPIKSDKLPPTVESAQSILDFKADNNIIQKKLHRMQEISTQNLLLHSDLADFQAELRDLRDETRELRMRCYDLTEENRQSDAEVRDLRRYVELLKSNSVADTSKDLLNKIEFYQMEHDRMMEEIRRLKLRLGEVSPRNLPQENRFHHSPEYTSSQISKTQTFENEELSQPRERDGSPIANALAASMASSFAASRLKRDRSLSPNVALNFRDLTMDRYNKHMEDFNCPEPVLNDCSELLLPHNGDYSNEDNHVYTKSGIGDRPNNAMPIDEAAITERHCSTPQQEHNTKNYNSPIKSLPHRAFAPRSPAELSVGHFIKFTRPGGKLSKGVVKYVGHLPTKDEVQVGVELDGFDGRSSGSFDGRKYFACAKNKGLFTPFSKVIMAWE